MPTVASTLRLPANFVLFSRLQHSVDVQHLWNNWSMVVNFKRPRALRQSKYEVFQKIYTLEDLPVLQTGALALTDRVAEGDDDEGNADEEAHEFDHVLLTDLLPGAEAMSHAVYVDDLGSFIADPNDHDQDHEEEDELFLV